MRKYAALLCALFATASAAVAAVPHQRWEATSTTAMSITGDVAFTPERLTFADGKSIAIAYVGVVRIGDANGGSPRRPVQLYRVLSRRDPTLLRGNTLCGNPPTFLTIAHEPDAATPELTLVIVGLYWDPHAPRSSGDHLCASYVYALQR